MIVSGDQLITILQIVNSDFAILIEFIYSTYVKYFFRRSRALYRPHESGSIPRLNIARVKFFVARIQ